MKGTGQIKHLNTPPFGKGGQGGIFQLQNLPYPLFAKEGDLKNQNGSALIITLLMVTILVALVVEFAYEVYIDTTSLSNWSDAQKASFVAKSGQTFSLRFIEEARERDFTDIGEITLPVTADLGSGVSLILKMEDENAKFNINSIIYSKGTTDENALTSLKKLFEYLNINTDLALVIADWIDPDAEPRLPDSEDNAKNAYIWSIDELKLIKGVDKDIYNQISPYITASEKTPWEININTAKLPVLVSLREDMTEAMAKNIIDYRESTPFEHKSQIVNVPEVGTSKGAVLLIPTTAKSSNFKITTTATVNGIRRVVESIVDQSRNIHFWREA